MINQLPERFLEKLTTYIPQEKLQTVLDAFTKGHVVSFRANTLKISSEQLYQELTVLGFDIEKVTWYNDAFVLINKTKKLLMATDLYQTGQLYIQNLSSMIPPLVLNPSRNDLVLDMAASPGSKTSELACLMENKGEIVANDKSPKRVFRLIANLKEQGVTNTKTATLPGEFMWRKFPEYFDKVLLDAPCSMEGRFSITDPDSYKDWSPRKIKELSNLQKWMLRSAISCTKVGGTIVYSTCATSPEENEEVIDWIIKKHGESICIGTIDITDLPEDKGLTAYGKRTFSPELSKTLRIYPSQQMEGFFIAKIKKLQPTVVLQ